jgi:hypothetical protein
MLDHHPELAVANDTHFVPRVLQKHDSDEMDLVRRATREEPIELTAQLLEEIWNYHRFYRMGIDREEFNSLLAFPTTYQQFVSKLFDAHAQHSNKRYAGEKTPDYIKHVPLLRGLFPEAMFVDIVRDGRNVALSLLDWASPTKGPGRLAYWRVDPIAVTALWWSEFVMAGKRYAQEFPKQFVKVEYEDVVLRPAGCLKRICEAIDLEYDPVMLEYHKGKQVAKSNSSAKKQWLPPTSNLRDWRNSMEAEDQAVFHCLAGDVLGELGFAIPNENFSRTAVKRASKATAWWEQHRPTAAVAI